jgi:hypothetical protein
MGDGTSRSHPARAKSSAFPDVRYNLCGPTWRQAVCRPRHRSEKREERRSREQQREDGLPPPGDVEQLPLASMDRARFAAAPSSSSSSSSPSPVASVVGLARPPELQKGSGRGRPPAALLLTSRRRQVDPADPTSIGTKAGRGAARRHGGGGPSGGERSGAARARSPPSAPRLPCDPLLASPPPPSALNMDGDPRMRRDGGDAGQPDLPRRRARSSSPGARTSGVLPLPPSAASGLQSLVGPRAPPQVPRARAHGACACAHGARPARLAWGKGLAGSGRARCSVEAPPVGSSPVGWAEVARREGRGKEREGVGP